MKKLLRRLVPESLKPWLRRIIRWRWFRGDYGSWETAKLASSGYADVSVLQRVHCAACLSRDGFAAWDRDGATFSNPEMHAPLLAALRASALAEGGRLVVVDFGGGLGGTWRQYRTGLADLSEIHWCIVEQPHFVEIGRKEFTKDVLSFEFSLADACARNSATVVLFSSVLQYLSTPHELLAEVGRLGFRHVIIDRTSFWLGGRDRLTVQFTPPKLGGCSYPCWLFDRTGFFASLTGTYECASEWPGFDEVDSRVQFHGMYFKRKRGGV